MCHVKILVVDMVNLDHLVATIGAVRQQEMMNVGFVAVPE